MSEVIYLDDDIVIERVPSTYARRPPACPACGEHSLLNWDRPTDSGRDGNCANCDRAVVLVLDDVVDKIRKGGLHR